MNAIVIPDRLLAALRDARHVCVLTGAGVSAENRIATDVRAAVGQSDGTGSNSLTADTINVLATDSSTIEVLAIGAAVMLLGFYGLVGRWLAPVGIRQQVTADRGCRLCDLTGEDLKGLDLTGADFTGAIFRGADLTGSVLKNAILVNTDLRYVCFDKALLDGATWVNGQICGPESMGRCLTPDMAILLESGHCPGCNLKAATLDSSKLSGAFLKSADLTRAALVQTNLNHANLIGVYDFGEVDGRFYLVMEYIEGMCLDEMIGVAASASR